MIDLNDAEDQRPDFGQPIPDGTYAKVVLHIQRGTHAEGFIDGDDLGDEGMLKIAKNGKTLMLVMEFTVTDGPYRNRKVFRYMVIKTADPNSAAINISKAALKAITNSVQGLDPADNSEVAKAKRRLPNFSALHGVEFPVKLGIEYNEEYGDKNTIAHILVPGDKEYEITRSGGGHTLPANPTSKKKKAAAAATSAASPGWGNTTQPSQPSFTGNGWEAPRPEQRVVPLNPPGAVNPPSGFVPPWVNQ